MILRAPTPHPTPRLGPRTFRRVNFSLQGTNAVVRRTRCTPWRVFVGARNEALYVHIYIYVYGYDIIFYYK